MKISVNPADVKACNEALSQCAAARQWATIVEAAGIDMTDELRRVEANERIATGLLQAIERVRETPA